MPSWVAMRQLSLLLLLQALRPGASKAGGSKKCKGNYVSPVVNLCEAHWPDAKSTRVWMVVFYTTW